MQFPYPRIYPEQYAYMLELKRSLDARGHAILEMPTGTGKTITLLSLITSYQRAHPEMGKLIYCTRTIPEMEKVLEELKVLESRRDELFGADRPQPLLALGLSSRRNLCVHERVSQQTERTAVDQQCRQMTASWVRAREAAEEGGPEVEEGARAELCSFFENLEREGTDATLSAGVYTLEELKQGARARGWCPYFLARHAISFANVVVYNYQYLLDPKIAQLISRDLARECVVVFDEAHNIDNICIEVMSINFRMPTLEACSRNLGRVSSEIESLKATDARRLQDEYARLVNGLAAAGNLPATDQLPANPLLPADIVDQAVPGNLRCALACPSPTRRASSTRHARRAPTPHPPPAPRQARRQVCRLPPPLRRAPEAADVGRPRGAGVTGRLPAPAVRRGSDRAEATQVRRRQAAIAAAHAAGLRHAGLLATDSRRRLRHAARHVHARLRHPLRAVRRAHAHAARPALPG